MALFGIFANKKKQAIPEAPKPPSSLVRSLARHKDDLEKPIPLIEGPLFPEIPKLDLPELEPAEEALPEIEKVPEHLPAIEEIKEPEEEVPEDLPELEVEGYAREKKAPLFINVGIYSQMIDQLNVTRAKLNEYASAATRVMEIRNEKDSTMEKFRKSLEDVERKLLNIDRIIFEGG